LKTFLEVIKFCDLSYHFEEVETFYSIPSMLKKLFINILNLLLNYMKMRFSNKKSCQKYKYMYIFCIKNIIYIKNHFKDRNITQAKNIKEPINNI